MARKVGRNLGKNEVRSREEKISKTYRIEKKNQAAPRQQNQARKASQRRARKGRQEDQEENAGGKMGHDQVDNFIH